MEKKHLVVVLLAIFLFGSVLISPKDAIAEGTWNDAGVGIGSVLLSLVYSPFKIVYALLGGITGGAAYFCSGLNQEVANNIWIPSVTGDYLITPQILRGEKPVRFVGTTLGE